jgi:hypothetical protein
MSNIQEIERAVSQLPPKELAKFRAWFAEFDADLWDQQPQSLSREEAALLQQINKGLPEEVWQRYRALVARRRAETLTPEEHKELIELSDRMEEVNARRMEHLVELARLRRMSLEAVMQQLGIRPRNV